MSLFAKGGDGWRHDPAKGQERRLVCRSGNPYGLPAKDRSGRLDATEPPDAELGLEDADVQERAIVEGDLA
jgi:hypothetical protein